ncbi:MAG TPA: hypothetical protein PLW02_13880, partial [Verrucomicrobiota bacterium]|nr:hypothetical protein [Verrucomicrobiota bacterium]
GSSPWWIQWYKNSQPISDATNLTVNFIATASDNGAVIYAVATNLYTNVQFTAISSNAILTVINDTNPPVVQRVMSVSTNGVKVVFSEPILINDLTNASNYSLVGQGAVIKGITAGAYNSEAIINTDPLVAGAIYTITISNLRDMAAAANLLQSTNISFIAAPYTVYDINQSVPGGYLIANPDGFEIGGGGTGIGDNSDQFSSAFDQKSGDFDYQMRVKSINSVDLWAKVGLMARETLSQGSKYAAVLSMPSVVGAVFEYRATNDTMSALVGNIPPNYPDCWLRLKRQGITFTGFASVDGKMWIKLGSKDITMSDPIYVGMVISSHSNGVIATAQISGMSEPTSTLEGRLSQKYEPPGP